MANIQERRDKSGKLISYSIRVHRGRDKATGKQLKPATMTFKVEPTWTEKSAKKKAEAAASVFEKQIKEGTATDTRLTFREYAEYVISLKERTGAKHKTIVSYRYLAERVYPIIGHLKLKDIRVSDLNKLYEQLQADGQNKRGGKLSAKSVIEHHRFVSAVLAQADKEMLIPFNPATKATLPKLERKTPNYFQPEEVAAIRDALESEPMKWKTMAHLLLITGARRGEVLGLKWSAVDFERNQIHICNNVLYAADRGIYEDTPKTATSDRFVTLPVETMQLLKQYKAWQATERLRLGGYYEDKGFLFAQDNGSPMHPDSVGTWLDRFAKRHDLPHINPHAFRHTMASMLYFNQVDSVSISKRLGHSKVSTTEDIYAHIIEEADQRSADILSDVFLKKA